MKSLQTAAKEYASHPDWKYVEDGSPVIDEAKQEAFLAGAEAAEGLFAEWASHSGYYYVPDHLSWVHVEDHDWITTEELIKLFKQ